MRKKQTQIRNKNKIIFSTGAVLFIIGFLGMVYNFWINPNDTASTLLPNDTIIFTEFNTNKNNLKNLEEYAFDNFAEDILAKNFPDITISDIKPWVGKKIALAWLKDGRFSFLAKYRNKNEAKKFMKKFLVAGEDLVENNFAGFTIYSPSFSSQVNFVFKNNWLITASDETAMKNILEDNDKLSHYLKFREISQDLPKNSDVIVYSNFEKLADEKSLIPVKNPFLKALTKTIPAFGVSLNFEEGKVNLKSKLLTTKGVFSSELLEKTPNEVIPELAQYAPNDVLFFMNGYDLNAKYLHTKKFLEEFNPQFSLVFDGLLRAEFKKIFGENFDFKADLLDRIKGQYALIFNFAEKENPFPYFALITKFGNGTSQESSEDLKIIIKKAQQNYSTKIVEHELPDGTSRKELVIADPDEINIKEKEESSHTYFTAETETGDESTIPQQKFSYGFLDNFLIISNHEQGLKDIFSAYTNKSNLTQNKDFRESVLFDFSAAESYGFINSNKLSSLLNFSRNSEQNISNSNSFFKKIRNISFARKTFPNEVLFSATLMNR